MPRTPNETVPSQFRLRPETLADLDAIAAHLAELTGRPSTRVDAIRYAARQTAAGIGRKKSPKKSSDSP